MKVTIDQFTAMKGHVADGCEVVSPQGKVFTIRATMNGWEVIAPDGFPCSGNLNSAFEVEYFVVNGLYSH